MTNPFKILNAAIQKVPFVKYALGVAGVAAAIAIIKSFGIENYSSIPVISILIMLGFMVLLFLFASLTRVNDRPLKIAGYILIYTTVTITCVSSILLASSIFFDRPKPITQYGIFQKDKIDTSMKKKDTLSVEKNINKSDKIATSDTTITKPKADTFQKTINSPINPIKAVQQIKIENKTYDYNSYWDASKSYADIRLLNYLNENGYSQNYQDIIRKKLREQNIVKVVGYDDKYSCSVSFDFFWIINENGLVSNIKHSTNRKNCSQIEINKLVGIINETIKTFKYKPITLKNKPIIYRESEIFLFYD